MSAPAPSLRIFATRSALRIVRYAECVERPRVGIGVLVLKEGKVLLGKRRGSHGEGEYASPGGHLEHMERVAECAAREVMEETGLVIGPVRFVRAMNLFTYAPKHYIDLMFAADWISGEPEVREPDKVEAWDWYALDALPSPLFATVESGIAALQGRGPVWLDAP